MKKIFLFLFISLSFLNASMLFDKSYPICIEDYYVKGGSLYYLRSSDGKWSDTTSDKLVQYIYVGYTYDDDNGTCSPELPIINGMSYNDFQFLNGLYGLLFGFFMLVGISYIFIVVGGKK